MPEPQSCAPAPPTPRVTRQSSRLKSRNEASHSKSRTDHPAPASPAAQDPSVPELAESYQLPNWLIPFVQKIEEVVGDGHCGFRAIAHCIGRSQDEWSYIRKSLAEEITTHLDFYSTGRNLCSMMAADLTPAELIATIRTNKKNVIQHKEHWLRLPGLSGIVASTFDRPVIFYSKEISMTTFPYFTSSNSNPPIVIAFSKKKQHYCVLSINITDPTVPIPRVCPTWVRNHTPVVADDWSNFFLVNVQVYLSMTEPKKGGKKGKKNKKCRVDLTNC